MREVVSNTSPLLYLHQLGSIDLLPVIYSQVLFQPASSRNSTQDTPSSRLKASTMESSYQVTERVIHARCQEVHEGRQLSHCRRQTDECAQATRVGQMLAAIRAPPHCRATTLPR
jgi:hypothetical protein